MNLQEIRIVVSTLLQQKKPEVSITTEQFNTILKVASLKHFKNTLGLPEEYSPGLFLASRLPEVTRVISEAIRPFIVFMGKKGEAPLFITDGLATIPSDYFYPLSMFAVIQKENGNLKTRKIEICTDKRWEKVLTSAVLFPTVNRQYCNFRADYIQFEPTSTRAAKFSYIRKPKDPIYALRATTNGYEYDPANSVQLEWDDTNTLDVINIFMGELSVPIGRWDVKNVTEKVKKEGI